MMRSDLSPNDWLLLSAYLDQQLDTRQISRLEARFDKDPTLKHGLHALEQTHLLLRSAPRRKAPRDFRLNPSVIPSTKLPVLFPVFSFVSAVAALLFVVLVLSDSPIGRIMQHLKIADELAPATDMIEGGIPETEMQVEDIDLPPVIIWGRPPSGPAMGMGGGGDGTGSSEPLIEEIASAPQPSLADTQGDGFELPKEELAAEMAAEPPSAPSEEFDQAPQEKEAHSQSVPATGEDMPDLLTTQDSAELLRDNPEVDPVESKPLDTELTEGEQPPGGPILGVKPSSTPGQNDTQPVEEMKVELLSPTRSLLLWFLGAVVLLFGFGAAYMRKNSR